jgi:hypothetical protein
MTRLKFTFILSIVCSLLLSQTEKPGYIVTMKGDTVKGTVKLNPKKEAEVFEKVNFKDQSGVQKNYKASKIKAYGVEDIHYRSVFEGDEAVFYRVVVSGDINLYEIVVEAVRMNEVTQDHEYYFTDSNNKKLVRVKENKFKKQMTERMKDNTSFIEEYGDDQEFNTEIAAEVISRYNAWKAGS